MPRRSASWRSRYADHRQGTGIGRPLRAADLLREVKGVIVRSRREARAEVDEVPTDVDGGQVLVRVERQEHSAAVQVPESGLSGDEVRDRAVTRDPDRHRAVALRPGVKGPGVDDSDRLVRIDVGHGQRLAGKDAELPDDVADLVEEGGIDLTAFDVTEDRKGALVLDQHVARSRDDLPLRPDRRRRRHNYERHDDGREK